MATTLTLSRILAEVQGTYANALDLETATVPIYIRTEDALADGVAINQADRFWSDTRTLGAASSEDLDLAGVLVNVFGVAVTFVKVKGFYIKNKSTTSTYKLGVGGAVANQFINWVGAAAHVVNIGADGVLLLTSPIDGYAVTAGTGDLLKIDNANAAGVDYDIVIWGTSA